MSTMTTWFITHRALAADIVMGSFFLIACLLLAVVAFVKPWRLRQWNATEIIMEIHPLWRVAFGTGGAILVLCAVLLVNLLLTSKTAPGSFGSTAFLKGLGFVEASAILFLGNLLGSKMGVTQLRFDLERRLYFYLSSLLGHYALNGPIDDFKAIRLSLMTRRGSAEEFAAIQAGRKRAVDIGVYFDWKVAPRKIPLLVLRFRSLQEAREVAEQFANALQLPMTEVMDKKKLY